jgi:glutamyl-tRNA synthetase
MDINVVVRGKEYLDQTAKYNLLYEAFGWEKPAYAHVAMVLGEDGTKLSKRNGDASFMDLYEDGYLPAAIVNYLVLLGWSPETNQEVFSMDELIKAFDPKRISKSSSQYDVKKLNWFNSIYIKNMPFEDYYKFIYPFLKSIYPVESKDEEWIRHLVKIYQTHISYGRQIINEVKMFFEDSISFDEECVSFMEEEGVDNTLEVFKKEIESISNWSVDNIALAINNTKEKANVKGKMLYMPIRIKTTGVMHGPELPDTLYLLGKEVVLKRLGE